MFIILAWLFAAVVAIHNLEEAAFLPAWSGQAGRWHRRVGASEFRFAVFVLTVLAGVAALIATVQGRESFGAYVLTGYALAMLLNVAFPHLLATLAMGRYMPGTATALVLNLPDARRARLRADFAAIRSSAAPFSRNRGTSCRISLPAPFPRPRSPTSALRRPR